MWQFDDAKAALVIKDARVAELERELESVKAALDEKIAVGEVQQATYADLQKSADAVKSELSDAQTALDRLKGDRDVNSSKVDAIQDEVCPSPFHLRR